MHHRSGSSGRIQRPPGGGSSISLGWDETPAPAARPRTRARTPPGGASSISLGWADDGGNKTRAKTPPPSRHRDQEMDADAAFPRQHAVKHWQRESSAPYACGSQRNVGNVTTGRPTTRTSANPGASHFSLGWDAAVGQCKMDSRQMRGERTYADEESCADGAPDAGRFHKAASASAELQDQSSNSFARGSQQNVGNVLTGRPTTRVSANPGGASSLSLGWGEAASSTPRQGGNRTPRRDAPVPSAVMDSCSRSAFDEAYRPADTGVAFQRGIGAGVNPLEDSSRGMRSLHDQRQPEPRGVSLDSESEAEQSVVSERGRGKRGPVTGDENTFGQRPRESANSFASGNQQNVGNVLTNRPTTRVAANPGGASSVRLGWDEAASSTPRQENRTPPQRNRTPPQRNRTPPQGNRTPRSSAVGGQSRADREDGPEASVSHPSRRGATKDNDHQFDAHALKSLKARMSKKQQQSTPPRGARISSTADDYDPRRDSVKSASSQGRDKPEVAGSKPKVWKPALAPQAPPGGQESFGCAYDERFDGRGRVDGAGGAGLNRDNNAIHALRYYQGDQRFGKHHAAEVAHQPQKQHVVSHRYFLEEQGQSEMKPGKARRPSNAGSDGSRHSLLAWEAEAPMPGRNTSARRQRTPPPADAALQEPPLQYAWRERQAARLDDVEADACSDDNATDIGSML